MSRDIEQHTDTNSAEFKQGVEAGLNGGKDMENWNAGNEFGPGIESGSLPKSKRGVDRRASIRHRSYLPRTTRTNC